MFLLVMDWFYYVLETSFYWWRHSVSHFTRLSVIKSWIRGQDLFQTTVEGKETCVYVYDVIQNVENAYFPQRKQKQDV